MLTIFAAVAWADPPPTFLDLGFELVSEGQVPKPGQGEAFRWWFLTSHESSALLVSAKSGLWWVPHQPSGARTKDSGVELIGIGTTGYASQRRLAVVDRELVMVGEGSSDRYHHQETDWVGRVVKRGEPSVDKEYNGSVIVADSSDAVSTFTVKGAKTVQNAADLSLVVRAHALSDVRAIRVDVLVRDDDVRPVDAAATDKAFVAADHVELWFTDPNRQLVQLGVARDAKGMPHARWLHGAPAGLQPPAVSMAGETYRIIFDEGVFGSGNRWSHPGFWDVNNTDWRTWRPPVDSVEMDGAPPAHLTWPFTVAASDADGGPGQDALIATSELAWDNYQSLGALALTPLASHLPPAPGAIRLR